MAVIFNYENLYRAHLNTRRGKSETKSILEFENNLLINILQLQKELSTRKYRISPYNEFKVYEPKTRIIKAPPYRDRVVQRCLCDNVLSKALEPHFIYDTYACRVGKGIHRALDRLTEFMRRYYIKYGIDGWVLKGDIKAFFYSIDQNILKQNLYPLLIDYDVYWILDQIITSCDNPGLPLGNQSSQWFANFYLSKFDHFVKEVLGVKMYIRYMDDFCLVLQNREEAEYCLQQIYLYLRNELKLELNHKTQIFPLRQGLNFLGFNSYLTDTGKVVRKVRQDSKKRVKRKLKSFKVKYVRGEITRMSIDSSYESWKGHVRHGNCYNLTKKMDIEYNKIFDGSEDYAIKGFASGGKGEARNI